ncbi:hypothetical protein F5Y19DRAFT_420964 [Xylariaceae sp. FL1651]|nr:hypothetical protein F5Y19DRAFT_420964 [Xylariaceae sp. FL1651]
MWAHVIAFGAVGLYKILEYCILSLTLVTLIPALMLKMSISGYRCTICFFDTVHVVLIFVCSNR